MVQKPTVLGQGTESCEQWINDRRGSPTAAARAEAWVLGYLTAYNAYTQQGENIMRGINVNDVFTWLDKYCQDDPRLDLEFASTGFLAQLMLQHPDLRCRGIA